MQQLLTGWLEAWQSAERGRFALWLPVCMGAGVLLYFGLRTEPAGWLGATIALAATVAACLTRRWPQLAAGHAVLAAVATGFAACQFATLTAAPVEDLPRTAVVIVGTVRGVETVPTGRRVTLDPVQFKGAETTLHRQVRVRLRADDATPVGSGDRIELRALIQPPAPPAYPGAWDLQRDAFFASLAGSGYALGAIQVHDHAATGAMLWIMRLRESVNQRIGAVLSGGVAALAQALLSGAMSGVPAADMAAFRDSGLAHLLSVSGLHIAIVMGIAVSLVRFALAAWPYAALRLPCKRIAALVGLLCGAFYMVLTGSQVPMVRSFIMAGFVALAVLMGRRALTMRSLAIAAALLILIEPYQLTGASLQMSFAAVMALLAGHEAFGRGVGALYRRHGWYGKAAAYVLGLILTSLLAGGATLPFGAYHFGHVQFYFALANLAAVPLTGAVVMPAGMLGLALMPLGWERPALVLMGYGIDGVLWIARTVAALPGATWRAPHLPLWGILAVAFGMVWLALWRSRLRLAGGLAVIAGLASPAWVRPADLLVSAEARLIAVRTPAGAFLQQVSGASRFTREAWLNYWAEDKFLPLPPRGPPAGQAVLCTQQACMLRPLADARGALLVRGTPIEPGLCAQISVIVSAEPARGLCPRPWPALVDRFTVWRNGAAAIWLYPGRAEIITDRAYRGERPWVPPVPKGRERSPPTLPPAATARAWPPSDQ